jgi:hypothetical protein
MYSSGLRRSEEDANTTRRDDRRPAKVMQEAAERLNVPYPTD